MPIDPSAVQWDPIDPAQIQWDDAPARKPAAKPTAAKKGGADFSSVRGGFTGSTERVRESARTRKVRLQAEGDAYRAKAEYDRMTDPGAGFFANMGQAVKSAGRALRQTGAGAKASIAESWGGDRDTANMLGLGGLSDAAAKAAPGLRARSNLLMAQEAATRQEEEGLMASPLAVPGRLAGNLAMTMVPGIALRGTAVGRALLPQTVRGNMALGAAFGAVATPYASDTERAANTGLGALFGGLIPGGIKVANVLANPIPRSTMNAGRQILADAGGNLDIQPSAVPGVQRTLGDATQNDAVMALERNARRQFPEMFSQIDEANNAARVAELQKIAGDEADIFSATARRDAVTSGARAKAFDEAGKSQNKLAAQQAIMTGAGGVIDPVAALKSQIRQIAQAKGGRPAVQRTLDDVSRAIDASGGTPQGLYNVRQTIGDLLDGKAGGDAGYARAATAELMKMRELVDAQLSSMAPSWGNYLQSFQQMSKPINRMQAAQELMSRVAATQPSKTGGVVLSPAQYARNTRPRMLDAIARKVTGFDKAKASDYFSPEDFAKFRAIGEDARREAARSSNRAQPGSATMEATELLKRNIAKGAAASVARRVPGVDAVIDMLDKQAQQKIAYLIANPNEMQRVMSALNAQDRRALSSVVSMIAARGSTAAPASTDRSGR